MKYKLIDKVGYLLRDDPELRNSDKKLLLAYWKRQGLELTDEQIRKFMDCTVAESITRARRALREEYPAEENIEQDRYNKFIDYKNNHAVSWIKD